jgi:glycosyltransferase involved in cell wall biosynthesis
VRPQAVSPSRWNHRRVAYPELPFQRDLARLASRMNEQFASRRQNLQKPFHGTMKIAYVTIADPADIRAWSGINHYILRALSNQPGVEVIPVGPLKTPRVMVSKLKTLRARLLPSRGRYLWTRDPGLLRTYARKVSRKLRDVRCDLIFSPGTEPIAYLETEKPIVCWTDAPFAAVLDYYPWYSNLSRASRGEGMESDTRALGRCDMAIFTSEWAADASVCGHRADPAKIRVLTFGPNLEIHLTEDQLEDLLPPRRRPPWRFLFVGVEWQRKGADIVLKVVAELNRRGYPSEMIVAGCRPPASMGALPSYLKLEGFLDKRSEHDRKRLQELYQSALFYFMPSRAETSGVVFCEANAFGVPCLAPETGGVPTLIENGINGQRFALDTSTDAYTDFIISLMKKSSCYDEMARRSLRVSRQRLNWEASAASLHSLLQSLLAARHNLAPTRIAPYSGSP